MPDKGESWSERSQSGNPTKSTAVNSCLARIKDMERKNLGAPSQAKRDMSQQEFSLLMELLRELKGVFFKAILCITYAVLAFNLCFRSDDVSKLKMNDVKQHDQFPFALKMCVTNSKNIKGNKACPDQIILGSMEPQYCPILHLALFMEEWVRRGYAAAGYKDAFLFTQNQERDDKGKPKGPHQVNNRFRTVLMKIHRKSSRNCWLSPLENLEPTAL